VIHEHVCGTDSSVEGPGDPSPLRSGNGPSPTRRVAADEGYTMLSEYLWRRFLSQLPWDERLLRATSSVRRGTRSEFSLIHGAWLLSISTDEATLANWVFGHEPARLDLAEFERRVESELEPCQACGTSARFPRLRDWTEYRLPDGAVVFMCPDCMAAAEPVAA
jgi:hypothetical protein